MSQSDLPKFDPEKDFLPEENQLRPDEDALLEELHALLQEDEGLSPEDAALLEEHAQLSVHEEIRMRHRSKETPSLKRRKVIFYTLVGIFSSIFLFCAIYLIDYLIQRNRDDVTYDKLGDIVASIQNTPTQTEDPNAPTGEPGMLPEYLPIYELNNDTVGWIRVPNTNINYPVMQSPDNVDYYLNHNFDKQTSKLGAIYVRETCDVLKPSDNVVIYGHFITSGQQMFTNLHKYIRKAFWEENQYITFDTLYEHHTYQVFAVFKTSGSSGVGYPFHLFNDALDKSDFDNYISAVKNLSFYNTGITPQYGDKLITLSTCEYTQANGRLVVVAVQVS